MTAGSCASFAGAPVLPPRRAVLPTGLVYSRLFPALASHDVALTGRGEGSRPANQRAARPVCLWLYIKTHIETANTPSTRAERERATADREELVLSFTGLRRWKEFFCCWILDFHFDFFFIRTLLRQKKSACSVLTLTLLLCLYKQLVSS